MVQVKSINVNTIFDKKTVKDHMNKPLVYIHGFADDYFTMPSKFGEQVGFKGDFVATNLLTGEIYESTAAFIPTQITSQLKAKMKDGLSVEIKFNLQATESDKNNQGYAWIAERPVTDEILQRTTALKAEAEKVKSNLKLLDKPASTKNTKSEK